MTADRATSEKPERVKREEIYLALLCQFPLAEPRRDELAYLLSRYSWQSQDHRAVYEALAGCRATPEAIRANLAAQLTRLGFPDTEIEEYFAPVEVSPESALAWLRDELPAQTVRAISRPNHPAESK